MACYMQEWRPITIDGMQFANIQMLNLAALRIHTVLAAMHLETSWDMH